MNIRKVMGRLNANGGSMDGGRGGIPEITPDMITASIGMARDEIGREIFCFAWWPDGAQLSHVDLHQNLRDLLMNEFSARFTAVSEAKLALHLLESDERKNRHSRAILAAQESVYQLSQSAWPRAMSKYDDIAAAVIAEICAPRQCPNCAGKGHMMHGALAVKCARCKGRGTVPLNKSWRARKLEVGETAYRNIWKQPYEWLYETVANRESIAARQIQAALGTDIEVLESAA